MADRFSYDVFLSHNSKDKPRVRALAGELRDAGLRVWFDEWVIRPGDDVYLAIERGLEAARVQVLCLSRAALASDWVAVERSTVLFRDPSNASRRFIPLLLTDCDLPDALRRYKYVDYRRKTKAALDELLASCRSETEPVAPSAKIEPLGMPTKATRPPTRVELDQAEPLAVLERKLTGQKGFVWGLAVSPDGTWAASGSQDQTVSIWDLESGSCRTTMRRHSDMVLSVATTPDGERVLSTGANGTVRIWDARSGRELAKLEGHEGTVWSVVALPDNTRALSGGFDNTLRLWDLASGRCLKTIMPGTGDDDDIFGVAVNPAGTQALSGHRDGRIRLWDLVTGECLARLNGHSDVVYSAQITRDARFAISGSNDQTVKVWDLEAQTCLGILEGHKSEIHSVAISPDGALIASTGFQDQTVRLWDWKSGTCLQVIEHETNKSPLSLAFSPTGSRLVVGTTACEIYVYSLTGVHAAPPAQEPAVT